MSAGVATFSGLSIDMVGVGYTLNATSSPVFHHNDIRLPSALARTGKSPRLYPAAREHGGRLIHLPLGLRGDRRCQRQYRDRRRHHSDQAWPSARTPAEHPTGGGAVTVSSGIATFSGLSINKVGTGYTFVASSSPSYAAATSLAFNITPGTSTQLAFVQRPTNTAAGIIHHPLGQRGGRGRQRQHRDLRHHHPGQPGYRDEPCRWNPYRRLGGHRVNGIATFSGLSINKRYGLHTDSVEHALVHRGHIGGLQYHARYPD